MTARWVVISIVSAALLTTAANLIGFHYLGTITVTAPASAPDAAKKIDWEHRSLDDQYKTAVHEAGHAVAARIVRKNLKFKEMWIAVYRDPDVSLLGLTVTDPDSNTGGPWSTDEDTVFSLGGGAAEKAIFRADPVFDSFDSDTTDDTLVTACAKGDDCGACPPASKVGDTCMLNGIVLQKHAREFARTVAIIDANKEATVALANLIMQQPIKDRRRHLDEAQIDAFFKEHAIIDPDAAPATPLLPAPAVLQ